jgi:hypothetical protein
MLSMIAPLLWTAHRPRAVRDSKAISRGPLAGTFPWMGSNGRYRASRTVSRENLRDASPSKPRSVTPGRSRSLASHALDALS